MLVGDYQGLKVYRAVPEDKQTKKDGTPRDPRKLGKIHYPVFTPDGLRVVGFMVKLPDVIGMIKQEDRFIALDALDVYEGVLVVADAKDSYDKDACERLGVDFDRCLIWTGMDARTESGKAVGYCSDASFNPRTGKVASFTLTGGAASSALVGTIEMPASYLKGYRDGAMIVSDETAQLELSGGAAAKAAEASVKINASVKKGAAKIDEHGSKALDKGSRALGKQLGKTKGMFQAFTSEYKKAAGTSKATGKKTVTKKVSSAKKKT